MKQPPSIIAHTADRPVQFQMGSKEGVKARETMCIVTAVQDGMWMHAEPRV